GVGGEAEHEACTEVADVSGAAGGLRGRAAVIARGPTAYAHPGVAGDALDVPDEHHRAEHAAVLAEPRREIRDLDRATLAVVEPGDEDRGVGEGLLLVRGDGDQLHREKT